MARDTSTGVSFEDFLSAELTARGIRHTMQAVIGQKPGGGQHRIDCVVHEAGTNGTDLLVSCKTQNVSGTAEEKVVYEAVKLMHALRTGSDRFGLRAALIMDGDGWSVGMRTFIEQELKDWLPGFSEGIRIYRSASEFIEHEFPASNSC